MKKVGYIYICPNCGQIIIYNSLYDLTFPKCKFGKDICKLPVDISNIYEEIRNCFSIGAYTAVSMLGRKLLMHIGVELGAENNQNFVYYVDYLDENHYIPPKSKNL